MGSELDGKAGNYLTINPLSYFFLIKIMSPATKYHVTQHIIGSGQEKQT